MGANFIPFKGTNADNCIGVVDGDHEVFELDIINNTLATIDEWPSSTSGTFDEEDIHIYKDTDVTDIPSV